MHLSSAVFVGTQFLAAAAAARNCMNMTIPVSIEARNARFDKLPIPKTNIDATAFALAGSQQGTNGTEAVATGFRTITGDYKISAKYCTPDGGATQKLQILTHGIGFDKTYWDLSYNNYNYSYIDQALAVGYSTLTYDRLGIGLSSHGNPRDEIQIFSEVAALAEVTRKVRAGTVRGIPDTFNKVIHVGHSFGSAQTYLLTAMYPNISDGIVLTGYSVETAYVPLFTAGNNFVQARLNQPLRFGPPSALEGVTALLATYGLNDLLAGVDFTTLPEPLDYPPGYLINANAGSTTYLFLLPEYFDRGILYFGEQGKQPVTVGEALTLGSLPKTSSFKGPVLVFTGSNDVPFCGGDCLNTGSMKLPNIPAGVKAAFPGNSKFAAYVQPHSGHGLNFHYNATAGYRYIQRWLRSNNL